MDALESIVEQLCQNAVDIISKEELRQRIKLVREAKRPLRVKAGFDPSAPDIHLGHAVLLRKLRQFQDFGHKVVLIIGDYTAMIGDPTGKTQTRPALSREEVLQNSKTYQSQAFKILDEDPNKIEIVTNSQWFLEEGLFRVFLENIGVSYTVARLLERDDFQKRMKEDQPITLREFIYPLLQGYDSVKVKADIEIGGNDQKFNLLVGRNLQRAFGQPPQIVMTWPLLVGLDGIQKMSKSLGNYIGINEEARAMFGKVMSIPDNLMKVYYELLTTFCPNEFKAIEEKIKKDPRNAKKDLARALVSQYHSTAAAERQAEEFDRVFRDKEAPQDVQVFEIDQELLWIVDLLRTTGLASSGSEARRLIEQSAVTINQVEISDVNAKVKIDSNGFLLRSGKKKYLRVKLKG